MSEVAGKPRLSYAEWQAQQKKGLTVAALIRRYIAELGDVKPIGGSQRLSLLKLARDRIGEIEAEKLTKYDVIDYCRRRPDISSATRDQYVGYLRVVLKYAPSAWQDCTNVSHAPVELALPFLRTNGLVAKSTPRSRRPTADEIERLLALFEEQNKRERNRIDMVLMAKWQIASARRVGESCSLRWEDWDRENYTIFVRKMKKHKNGRLVALPKEAQAMLVELWEKRDPAEPRILPFNSHSVSARYTEAKHILGIKDLRLHDSRREACSRFVEQGFTAEESIGFSGHVTTAIFQRNYMRPKVERLKDGPALLRKAA